MCITYKRTTKLLLLMVMLCFEVVYSQSNNTIQLARQYYDSGETEKAIDLYEGLANKKSNIPFIHSSYYELLLTEKHFADAEKYITKVKKWFPDNISYQIDEGLLYLQSDNDRKAEQTFQQIINTYKTNPTMVRTGAQQFFQRGLPEYAIEMYLKGRKATGDASNFAIELANIYRRVNNKDAMIEEYLNFINENPANVEYVQNVMQNLLTETEDLQALENVLYDKIQKQPNNMVYSQLLIWVNLQLQNFHGAFIQARALDKRNKEGGKQLIDIGVIALRNKDYSNAEQIFEYVIKNYTSGINYEISRRYLIKSREELVKNTFPVDEVKIGKLIDDYQQLITDIGINNITLEALRSKALLHAFYLDEKDTAIQLLEKVINTQRADPELIAQAKINLGDIFLLENQPWESTLLYGQVEKSVKETPIAYLAKLKNAKLSYYKGDFQLAQSHLDVLKLATSREIANDAIELSLLIKDNIAFDTTEEAMRDYAAVDLMLFQNKRQEALQKLDTMLAEYPGHSLTDEIWWRQAHIWMELGNFDKSLALLKQVVEEYPYDIISDDAYFLMGTILEDQLSRKEEAMEVYQSLLKKFPGSLYTAEARKRFRKLRGDYPSL